MENIWNILGDEGRFETACSGGGNFSSSLWVSSWFQSSKSFLLSIGLLLINGSDLDSNAGDNSKDGNTTERPLISSGGEKDADDTTMWEGGELVFPQISAYVQPRDGDFLAWRTNRLLHGVAPFAEGGNMGTYRRAAFVFFQTEAVHHGCLNCSD